MSSGRSVVSAPAQHGRDVGACGLEYRRLLGERPWNPEAVLGRHPETCGTDRSVLCPPGCTEKGLRLCSLWLPRPLVVSYT